VQEHSLIGLAEVQGVADLLGVPATDVAQRDHLALARGQIPDRAQHDITGLGDLELVLRILPGDRGTGPPARPLAATALELIWIHRRASALLVAPSQQRERHDPPLALAPRACLVEGDAGEPRPKRGPTLEPVEAVQDGEPGVADDLLGDRAAGHVHHHQPHEKRPVLGDQAPKRVLVPPAQPRHELRIGVGRGARRRGAAARAFLLWHRRRFSHAPRSGFGVGSGHGRARRARGRDPRL
jgi:hypothetical protein